MDRQPLNFGFSSCPNDTFAFHALVHGLVPGPPVTPHIDDVEALNARAERGDAEVTKISIAAYERVRDRYALLRAGGAAGFGVGPIVVARGGRGQVDSGVLIHEGRFTYESKGLTLVADLGALWEERMQCPLPLAAIAIRRDLAAAWGRPLDAALRASVEHAFAHPADSRDYVATHAQEMDPSVVAKHIALYVNDYTRALDERAVQTLLDWARDHALDGPPESTHPVFV